MPVFRVGRHPHLTVSHLENSHYLDGVHELGLIMLIKVPDDAAALSEEGASEVPQRFVPFDVVHKRLESGRKEVDAEDA